MKVGDLVKAVIVDGHPIGIVTKIDYSRRFGALVHVHVEETNLAWPLLPHQLEVISAKK